VPCITLRENTEWVETVEAGWNVLVGAGREEIVDAIQHFLPGSRQRKIFGGGNASVLIRENLTGHQDARSG